MPSYVAQNVQYSRAFMNTVMSAFKTVPGGALVATGKLRLFNSSTFTPTPGMVLADLTAIETLYSGYTAGGIAVVLSAPVNLGTQSQGVLFTTLFEAVTATPFVADVSYGWWIDDGTNVVAAERFAAGASFGFGSPGAYLVLTAILPGAMLQLTS
jgi:hypothetical protein